MTHEANMSHTAVLLPQECISGAAERRAWVRYPCELSSSCQPIVASRSGRWSAKIRNISAGGVGISLDRRFELQTLLSIEAQQEGSESSVSFLARVMHVTRQEDGTWLLGCSLRHPLSDEDLKGLL